MTNCRRTGALGFMSGVAALVICTGSSWAAQDYEFAQGLLNMDDQRRFPTEELVERLANHLDASNDANQKMEGKLVRALLRRKQAESASAEKRNDLLMEADKLYQDFKANGANHRLKSECEEQADSIQLDFARSLVKAASENPAKASEFHAKAVEILDKIANVRKEEAEKSRPAVKEALKAIDAFFEKNPESEQAPRSLIDSATKVLNTYIPNDKRYVIARAEQVDAYAESDPKKKDAAQELIKYCEAQIGSEELSRLEDVTMWYHFMSGRLYSNVLMEDKAAESWKNALDISIDGLPAEARKGVFEIKKLIYRDLVKMKMRTAPKDPKKYKEVIEIVGSAEYEPAMKTFFDEPVGKDLMIDYAFALVRQPDPSSTEVETAIKKLRRIVEQGPPWSNNASRAMAQILNDAHNRKPPIRPKLSAQEWFDVARGFFIDGQIAHKKYKDAEGDAAKAQTYFVESCEKYQDAVEYYRRAIGQARNPASTDLPTRLLIEPQAWFEMGLCYLKMEHYYEAVIAYQSLRTNFRPKDRAKWLPDSNKDKAFYSNKLVKAAFDKLDGLKGGEEGLLSSTEKNIVIALNLNARTKTSFNTQLKVRIIEDEGISLGDQTDTDYQAGKLAMDSAGDLKDQGESFKKTKKLDEATKQYQQALDKYKEAAARFEKVKPTSKAYEVALYQAATCWYLAQTMISSKQTGQLKPEDMDAMLKEFGDKALADYKAYDEYVAKEADPTDEGQARRAKLGRGVRISRCAVYFNMKDWDNTIKTSDEYADAEAKANTPKDDSKLLSVLFYKFQALSHKAGEKNPPECDTLLAEAEKLIPAFADSEKYYDYILNNISARYSNAAARAKTAQMDAEGVNKYNSKVALYQAQAVERKNEAERSLDDYGRLLYLYKETKKLRQAADIADKMLQRFDPKNQNAQVMDEEWPAIQEKMNSINTVNAFNGDLDRQGRAKKDHLAMLDFIYDTEKGVNNRENPNARPDNDKFDVDYQKALDAISTLRKEYPNAPTVKPVASNPDQFIKGKSYLDYINEEIEFRRRIIATRDLLSEISLEVAEKFEKDGDEENAKKYRTIAGEQIKVLESVYGNVPAMKLKLAEINISNKDYQGALDVLMNVKNGEPDRTSDLYVKASKRISEVFKMQGKWVDAAEYPQFIASTAGLKSRFVEKFWPEMEKFLEECYANGVPRPKDIAITKKIEYRMKTPDEAEFEQLQTVWDLGQKQKELLTPAFLWRYNFLKGKVDHFKEYSNLERMLLTYKGKQNEKEFLTTEFMSRYETIKSLVGVESDFWKLHRSFQDLITKHGGPEKVPSEEKKKYDEGLQKVKELNEKLGGLKPIKIVLPDETAPAAEEKTEEKTGEAKTEAKLEVKSEAKSEAKSESKTEAKSESKTEAKSEAKTE